jgi:uncharacterized protein (DUF1697 family)
LEQHPERQAQKRLGLQTDFFVRTIEEWEDAIAHNPFRDAAKNDASHLLVAVLKSAPTASQVKALETDAVHYLEKGHARGKVIVLWNNDGTATA